MVNTDGAAITPDSLRIFSSFGLIRTFKIQNGGIVVEQDFRRLIATERHHQGLDTIFPADILPGSTITLVLQPKSVFMEEFVISTTKALSRLSRSSVSVSLLKPYLINNKITSDIGNVLEQIPGVTISDGQVNIRNGSGWSYGAGSRVMVTLDELPMISPDAGAVQFGFLPVENLASVEVVKSAGSVLYGSSALNGVINLRSAEPESKPNARVSAFAGVYDFPGRDSLRWNSGRRGNHGVNGYWSQKINNTAVTLQWNALYDQGWRKHEYNHRGRLGMRLSHQSARYSGLRYGLNFGAQQSNSGSFLLWQSYTRGYETQGDGFNYNKGFRVNVDPFVELKKGNNTHKILTRYLALENNATSNNAGSDQSNGSSLLYTEYRFNKQFKNTGITLGATGMLAETHSPLYGGKQTAENRAVFFQAEQKAGRLTLSGGGRYEYYAVNNNTFTKPVFRAGINYAAGRATFLRGSAGQGFRFPSMAELFVTTSVGQVSVFANPALKPETGQNAELGLKQGYRLGGFKGFADLSVFQMNLNNMMEFSFGQWDNSGFPGFKSINVGTGKIRGFELETAGEGKLGNTLWQLMGGYTYTSPVVANPGFVYARDSAGQQLNFVNTRSDTNNYMKYRYRHLFRLDAQCKYKKAELGVSLRYNSRLLNIDGAFTQGILPLFIPGIKESMQKAGTAFVVDLRAAWLIGKQWKLNAQINNLFNREYVGRPADIRPPRSFQLQLVWNLR